MTIVDTSVWIEHFRRRNAALVELLEANDVLMHPDVTGELACGSLRSRARILSLLDFLPTAPVVETRDVRRMVEARRLWGRGLGWIDAGLLAAALAARAKLWTLDRALAQAADRLGVA